MSAQFGKICSLILLEHFGEIVQKVGTDLFQWGQKPFGLIVSSTGLPSRKVKQALAILIQYGLVSFTPGRSGNFAEYSVMSEKVFSILRYPSYLYLMKSQYGVEAEMLVEEFLRQGFSSASQVILKAASRLNESKKEGDSSGSNLALLRDKFVLLVNKQFLMRCPSPIEVTDGKAVLVPDLKGKDMDLYLPPSLNLRALTAMQQGGSDDPGDNKIYWKVNFDRFHQDFRDRIITDAVSRRIDDNAGELMRLMLQLMYIRTEPWVSSSNPIPYVELKDTFRKQDPQSAVLQYLDQYLKVIEEDSNSFISRSGDSGGGQYTIHMKTIFEALTWTCIENVIVERFGSKAARIFRLVKAKKVIEQERIQQIAMIPAREAKQLTYRLLHENFLQLQELRKSMANNAGPNKTFFLFHINLEEVARMVLDMSYKALYNAMTRRDHESLENRRLIEKKQRIDSIALNMREQGATSEQLEEIEEMMTPPEHELLEKVKSRVQKLSEAELQVEQTVFLMQLYLNYVVQ